MQVFPSFFESEARSLRAGGGGGGGGGGDEIFWFF